METSTETQSNPPLKSFFNSLDWGVFALITLAGLLLRWLDLDARPVHHDESLHMMYGRYFYDFPDIQYYKYDPMLHGPFLYNILRLVYSTLGSTTEAARALPALLGSTFIFMPLLFRRYFSKNAVLFLTAAIALSPTLTYWSRFIREDIPVLFALAILLYGCILSKPQYRWILGILSFTIQICIKENVFVTAALIVGYLVYEAGVYLVIHQEKDVLAVRMWRNLRKYPVHALCGLALGAFIYCHLFSAGFRYPQGITDFVTKSVSYWAGQHSVERIKGPFNFHIYLLAWYELPFVILSILALVRFYIRGNFLLRAIGGFIIIMTLITALAYWNKPVENVAPWDIFKLKDVYDIIGLFILTPHAVLLTTDHLLRRERALGFWGYLFTSSFFTYSYLGEKVPWLAVYAFVPGLIYLALLFDFEYKQRPVQSWERFPVEKIFSWAGMILGALSILFALSEGWIAQGKSLNVQGILGSENTVFFLAAVALMGIGYLDRVPNLLGTVNLKNFCLAVLCFYSLRANILTNFVYAGKAREYISQVHTTPEFNDLILSIRKEAVNGIRGYKPLIYATGEVVWPITWYLIDIPEYKFIATPEERKNFRYQFIDYTTNPADTPAGFHSITINLRGWWVPDFNKMTLKNFLNYSINHTPWGDVGYTYTTLLVKDAPQETAK